MWAISMGTSNAWWGLTPQSSPSSGLSPPLPSPAHLALHLGVGTAGCLLGRDGVPCGPSPGVEEEEAHLPPRLGGKEARGGGGAGQSIKVEGCHTTVPYVEELKDTCHLSSLRHPCAPSVAGVA